jgi:hypothetical protein
MATAGRQAGSWQQPGQCDEVAHGHDVGSAVADEGEQMRFVAGRQVVRAAADRDGQQAVVVWVRGRIDRGQQGRHLDLPAPTQPVEASDPRLRLFRR